MLVIFRTHLELRPCFLNRNPTAEEWQYLARFGGYALAFYYDHYQCNGKFSLLPLATVVMGRKCFHMCLSVHGGRRGIGNSIFIIGRVCPPGHTLPPQTYLTPLCTYPMLLLDVPYPLLVTLSGDHWRPVQTCVIFYSGSSLLQHSFSQQITN